MNKKQALEEVNEALLKPFSKAHYTRLMKLKQKLTNELKKDGQTN